MIRGVLHVLRVCHRGVRNHRKQLWRQVLNEPLNHGRKARLLRNYATWHIGYKYRGRRWVISFENGLKSYVYPYPDHDAGEVNIWTRNVDFYDLRLARAVIDAGDFVVDAGCNVGNRTLALADLLSGALLIDAGNAAVRRCRENIELNALDPERFTVLEAAVGESPGEVFFTDLGGASTTNKVVGEANGSAHTVRVPLTTIDAEVERVGRMPSYIKVDVEGQDYRALRGARKTLASGAVRLVKFERHQTEPLAQFEQLFHELDWTVFALDRRGRVTSDRAITERALNLFAAPRQVHDRLSRLAWD